MLVAVGTWHGRAHPLSLAGLIQPRQGKHVLGEIDADVQNECSWTSPSERVDERLLFPSWHLLAGCRNAAGSGQGSPFHSLGLMKTLASLLLAVPLAASAAPGENWLAQVPASAGNWRDWDTLAESSFFEVPASRLPAVEAWLSDVPYLLQEPSNLGYLGRPDFKCSGDKRLYLVRALYVNGGTGRFDLAWTKGSALVVSHASLGPGGPASKSAIVACLPGKPTAVFSSISGAL